MQTISASALANQQKQGVVNLIDVRTPAEFGAIHAKGAVNIPLDKLEPGALAYCNGSPVYFICKSGVRAQKAMDKLRESGFSNMVQVEGGTDAWKSAGLPIEKGKKALGLEQQVRIIAGSMALVGAAVVLAGQPLGLILVGFMGAGMVFAGITDTCGMAMLLAKMPWNQDARACSTSSASA
ncbi:MAG TPA: rhodanese-like domain-containing protein [Thiobacillaceae bacterium]|nr:rhodanese-like domain-containing protein [Thiobacillaceae bacterium]